MKKITKIVVAFIVSVFIFSSCKKDTVYGSGAVVTQDRTVAAFSKVKTEGDIDVVIWQAATQKVTASDYSNLINDIETIVVGDELIIKNKTIRNIVNSKSQVIITMPSLSAVYTTGSADINVNGAFAVSALFTATTRGSGDISLNAITVNDFNIIAVGSGDVNITNSQTKNANINIDGSGDVSAFGLQIENAIVETRGSGDARTSVSIQLNATIKGSGDIYYKGNPSVTKSITGSGELIKQ